MSWQLVARKDLRDAVRQYHLHFGAVLFVLLLGGMAVLTTQVPGGPGTLPPTAVPYALAGIASFLVPLVAIGFSQGVVVGMRTRGDLKLFLGLPFSRRDLVLGSFVGRTVFVCLTFLAGAAVATLVAVARGAPMAFGTLATVAALVGVLAAIFVAISIGISASVSTETRSGALAIGVFFLLVFQLWGVVPDVLAWIVNGFGPGPTPEWVPLLKNLNPVLALYNVLGSIFPGGGGLFTSATGSLAVYRTIPFARAVLAAWIVLPLALGYRRFSAADL